MKLNIRISGAGGHGIVFAGRVLGLAFAKKGYDVALRPSYSPAQRGGWSRVDMVISEEPVLTPIFEAADVLIVTTQDRYNEDLCIVRRNGYIIYTVETVAPSPRREDVAMIGVRAFELSERATGDRRYANSVLVGFFASISKLIDLDTLVDTYRELKVRMLEENIKALRIGYEEGERSGIRII